MPQILLSICIPTYNRSRYLRECLESIIAQLGAHQALVEIVVSDNHSQDDTEQVVMRYAHHHSNLRYFKNDRNEGGTKNFSLVVEKARGKYIWFCGDDDLIEVGAVATLLQVIQSNPKVGFIFISRQEWNADFSQLLNDNTVGVTQDIYFDNGFELYTLKGKVPLAGVLGYISSMVFVRDYWISSERENPMDPQDMFGQLRTVLGFINKYPCYYLGHPFVKTRVTSGHYYSVSISKISFEDLNEVYNYALRLGYSPEITTEIKKNILHKAWRALIADKAMGVSSYSFPRIREVVNLPLREWPISFSFALAFYLALPVSVLSYFYRFFKRVVR